MMTDLSELIKANATRWDEAIVNSAMASTIDRVATRLIDAKQRYKTVESKTHVPWWVIAVIHEREASQSWRAQLGQGDPLDSVSIHVPRGRGPFKSWEDGAYDALVNTEPFAARWKDWSWGGAMTLLETYNGLGYWHKGKPSPYVWASTNQYQRGKYVSDGHYDPDAVDHQIGCAALVKRMKEKDATVQEIIPGSYGF